MRDSADAVNVAAAKCALLGAAMCSLFALCATACAQDLTGPGEVPVIVTSGVGTATVPPDMATLRFVVSATARTAREAAGANAKNIRAVLDSLEIAGIELESISTTSYSVHPRYKEKKKRREITGYTASTRVNVNQGDLDKVGDVVDAVLGAGATQLRDIGFKATDPIDARDGATAEAVEVARHTAETLAQAAGGRLGKLLMLSTVRERAPRHMYSMTVSTVPLIPPDIVINVEVTSRWEFISE